MDTASTTDTRTRELLRLIAVAGADTRYNETEIAVASKPFVAWCLNVLGTDADVDAMFTTTNIERFANTQLGHYVPASRGNIRSRLLRLAELLTDLGYRRRRLTPLPSANPLQPYDEATQVSLRSWARSQGTPVRQRDATVLIALGLGAGLSASEMSETRTGDVDEDPTGIRITVREGRPRSVWLLRPWADLLRPHLPDIPEGAYLFRSSRQKSWPNVISSFVARDRIDVRPQTQRMRATWIVHHLNAGTNLAVLVNAAGVESLEAFTRYLRFVQPVDTSSARAQMEAA